MSRPYVERLSIIYQNFVFCCHELGFPRTGVISTVHSPYNASSDNCGSYIIDKRRLRAAEDGGQW